MATASFSQFATAVFYLALILSVAAEKADLYFFTNAWSTAAPLLVSVGVMYPLWLRGLANSRRWWIGALGSTSLLSGLGGVASFWVVSHTRGVGSSDVALMMAITALGMANGAFMLAAWHLASLGAASWANVISAVPAVFGLAGLAMWRGSSTQLIGATLFQTAGTLLFAALAYRRVGSLSRAPVSDPSGAAVLGLIARSGSGYGFGLATQSAAMTLPAGGVSVFNILSRGTSAAVAILVNAVLPTLIHSDQGETVTYWRHLDRLVAGSLVLAALAAFLRFAGLPTSIVASLVMCCVWIGSSALNAMTQLVMLRQGNEAGVLRVVGAAAIGMAAVGLVVHAEVASVEVLLAAAALVEVLGAVGAAVGSDRLKPTLAWSGVLCGAISLTLVW